MNPKPTGKDRTRPCTPIYRALMVEFERQRLARGLSMAQVDDLAGINDGHYGHMLYPDTPCGRQSRWETVQEVADALFERAFEITITPSNSTRPSAPSLDKGASSNALENRHWRHRRHYQHLGALGAKARNENLSKAQRIALARKGGRMWKKICAAKRRGEERRAT